MSGSNKYSNIKHRKGAQDARRSRIFSKLSAEILVAVREGGDDPALNPRLRAAIQTAKKNNMPRDNIVRAIVRASGAGGETLSEITFEGYAPHGVAVFVETATDNNNRTVMHVRSQFSRHGGALGVDGCLSFIFSRCGVFHLDVEGIDVDELLLDLIDVGIQDWSVTPEGVTLITSKESFSPMLSALKEQELPLRSSGLRRLARVHQPVTASQWASVKRMVDALEAVDDVLAVYHNARLK